MQSISLCVRLTNEKLRQAQEAVTSAVRLLEPEELLVSAVDIYKPEAHGAFLLNLGCPNVRFFPGILDRAGMIPLWYALFDAAKTEWIVNIDDDDIPLGPLPLNQPDNVGYVHTDLVHVYTDDAQTGHVNAGDVLLRRSSPITRPSQANKAYGSYWAMRTAAWRDISAVIERDKPGFNDFKIVWHLLRVGWKTKHIPHILQLIRTKPPGSCPFYTGFSANGGWRAVHERLEAQFCQDPI